MVNLRWGAFCAHQECKDFAVDERSSKDGDKGWEDDREAWRHDALLFLGTDIADTEEKVAPKIKKKQRLASFSWLSKTDRQLQAVFGDTGQNPCEQLLALSLGAFLFAFVARVCIRACSSLRLAYACSRLSLQDTTRYGSPCI